MASASSRLRLARPSNMFSGSRTRIDSEIEVVKDGERVDGKSILAILTLVALQGTELSIEARGQDADEAFGRLIGLDHQTREFVGR